VISGLTAVNGCAIKILYLQTQKLNFMRYLCSVIFLLGLLSAPAFAQTDTLGVSQDISSQTARLDELLEKLPIRQDPRITDLLIRHSQINQKKHGIDGYRLEIFFSSGSKAREQAERMKNECNLIYPEIPAYLLFQTPNFKVRIGDFRNKSEALKAKARIEAKFPNAFIVKDIIRFPELFTESVEQSEEQ
jgi:hypothetical protein